MYALAARNPTTIDSRRLRLSANLKLWQHKLCHLVPDNIKKVVNKVKGMVTKENKAEEQQITTPCSTGAAANLKKTLRSEAEGPLEQVYANNAECSTVPSFNNKMGCLWVDKYSKSVEFMELKQKGDFVSALKEHVTYARAKAEQVKQIVSTDRLQTPQGETKKLCDSNGIKSRQSTSGEQNETVEKTTDTAKKEAKAIRHYACSQASFWLPSMKVACYILQLNLIARFEGVTACIRAYGQDQDVSHLQVNGCIALYYNRYVAETYFQAARALKGVLVGYCNRSQIYALKTKGIVRPAEVVHEHIEPLSNDTANNPGTSRGASGKAIDVGLMGGGTISQSPDQDAIQNIDQVTDHKLY